MPFLASDGSTIYRGGTLDRRRYNGWGKTSRRCRRMGIRDVQAWAGPLREARGRRHGEIGETT
jgi:hypothetical protein